MRGVKAILKAVLSDGVTVAQGPLEAFVMVRIHVGQPLSRRMAEMKDSYIAAKERWARKMTGRAQPAVRSADRLPPGQRQVHNFPVLDLGVRPDVTLDK